MALTHEQIWAMADDLEAKGAPATLVDIRSALGGGSYSTICSAMRIRKDRRAIDVEVSMAPLPHSVAERLAAFGAEVWSSALASANERLQVDRLQFDQARKEIDADRNEVAALATQATAELDATHLRLQAQEAAAAALRGEIHDLNAQVGHLSERLAGLTAQADESGRRVADLNHELERVNQANASLIRALADRGRDVKMKAMRLVGKTGREKAEKTAP